MVLDIASMVGDNAALAEAPLWLIGIGIVGALLAAVLGLLDLSTIPRGTKACNTGITHSPYLVVVMLLVLGGRHRDPGRIRMAGRPGTAHAHGPAGNARRAPLVVPTLHRSA